MAANSNTRNILNFYTLKSTRDKLDPVEHQIHSRWPRRKLRPLKHIPYPQTTPQGEATTLTEKLHRVVERFNEIVKAGGKLKEPEVEEVYNALPPVAPEALIGKWEGGSFNTGHPVHEQLTTTNWAGKDFHSVDQVDPIMINDSKGNRVHFQQYGHALVS